MATADARDTPASAGTIAFGSGLSCGGSGGAWLSDLTLVLDAPRFPRDRGPPAVSAEAWVLDPGWDQSLMLLQTVAGPCTGAWGEIWPRLRAQRIGEEHK